MAHTINLAAKGILRPFDTRQTKNAAGNGDNGDDNDELANLLKGLNIEELQAELLDLEENGVREADDDEGLVDVLSEMTGAEQEEWAEAVVPLQTALVKVSDLVSVSVICQPDWFPPRFKIS